ncbi:restriction endonuclease subunit S [Providencia manganoxydans]|uniref:restriction endonuclease subunit S n=1 Tax=Providencia manganoxydans TaxID=2923283 RepID=UPI0034E42DA0
MVPEGWKAYSLIDITKWSSGSTPSKSENDFWGGDIPWISAVSMKGIFYSDSDLKVTEKALKHSAKVANENDILLLVRGSMLWNKIPVGIATRAMAFNQDVKCIKADTKKVDVRFLLYWFLAKEKHLLGMVTGTGIGAGKLDTSELQSLDIYLPCLSEQKKIAKILSTWDKAISTTEKLIATSQQQKKALMQQLLTGKKRLVNPETGKVFDGDWKKVELGKLLDYKQPTPYLVKSTEYSDEYPTPVLTAGKTFILGYSNEDFGIFSEELPVIIFDDFTTASKFVNFPFKAKSSAMKILIAKDGVSIKYVYEAMQVLNYPVGGHQRHWISIFANLVIELPEPEEQQKIAAVLTNADKEIELLQAKLAHLKDEKKALMQQLLTGKRRVKVDENVAA